jgi:hypothetical protein
MSPRNPTTLKQSLTMKTTPRLVIGFDPALYPKFRNANGTLTGYSFACGYVECYGEKTAAPSATISREANDFHVEGFDRGGSHFWEIFETAREARRFARSKAGKMRLRA